MFDGIPGPDGGTGYGTRLPVQPTVAGDRAGDRAANLSYCNRIVTLAILEGESYAGGTLRWIRCAQVGGE